MGLAGQGGDRMWFRAPGRVNLMGDHTDYNEGFVLPVAIDLECVIGVRARVDRRVVVRSLDVSADEAVVNVAADGTDEPAAVDPAWGRYVAGVVRSLAEAGRAAAGLDAVLFSTVPLGSGLSSSAALEVACALALGHVASFQLPPAELALACQHAEHIATGVPSGIMDQLVCLAGQPGAALLLDCRSLEHETVQLPSSLSVLAVHSGLPRTLGDSAYAERRAACEAAAARLGLRALRDATPEQVADDPFARHVVNENARVLETAAAIRTGDLDRVAALYAASHASLRDDFRVSTPELDMLVSILVGEGALGARLTGAGFGGCVVAVVRREDAPAISERATRRYRAETGREPQAFLCRAAAGAGITAAPTTERVQSER
jgi:galactokinase